MSDEQSMVDRVARALEPKCRAFGQGNMPLNVAREFARAAIEAMHEPTDAMAEAAYQAVKMSDAWCIEDDTHWKRSFRASISAALAEPQS